MHVCLVRHRRPRSVPSLEFCCTWPEGIEQLVGRRRRVRLVIVVFATQSVAPSPQPKCAEIGKHC